MMFKEAKKLLPLSLKNRHICLSYLKKKVAGFRELETQLQGN